MKKKMSAYKKDIWRSIGKSKKRFIAIMIITFLGTMMFSGLKAACVDLRHSADNFYDNQCLFDLCIMSTLGLTEEDLDAIRSLEEVETVEGVYSETVHAVVDGSDLSVALKTYYPGGINQPYVVDGHLPEQVNEVAITEKFSRASGLEVGDTFLVREDLKEEEETTFKKEEFQVSAIIIDPLDVNNAGGSLSFRTSSMDEDTAYVLPEVIDSDIYTAIYIALDGSRELFCYSDEYEDKVQAFCDYIEAEIKEQRIQARTEEVKEEAFQELADAEKEVYDELAKAEQELLDAETKLEEQLSDAEKQLEDGEAEFLKQIADAKEELLQGERDIQDGLKKLDEAEQELKEQEAAAEIAFAEARQQIVDGYLQLEEGQRQLDLGKAQLELGEIALNLNKESLSDRQDAERELLVDEQKVLEQELNDNKSKQAELQDTIANSTDVSEKLRAEQELKIYQSSEQLILERQSVLKQQEAQIDAKHAGEWAEIYAQEAELESGKAQLQAGQNELNNGRAQLDAGLLELEAQELMAEQQFTVGREQIAEGRCALESGKADLIAGWVEFEAGKAEGEAKLEEGRQEFEEGKTYGEDKLEEGWLEFEGGKAEAEAELADARKELADMDVAEWYLQNRNSLSSYTNIKSDADSIESIAKVFPVVFFVVAILISLTTITRMVEEDRGLIGTYKALGFYDGEIRKKYLLYAFCASSAGSAMGTLGAFLLLPAIICFIFSTMYLLPNYVFLFEPVNGLLGPFVFIGGIVLATFIACRNELVQTPVSLMRPKTPKEGSRVILEAIPAIWNHMSFLNKVTARNLFRYKKRLLMTISGIAGCMALLLFGFAIKDSVTDLVPRQYEKTFFYDAIVVAGDNHVLQRYLAYDPNVAEYLNGYITSVTLENADGKTESVQLMVFPDGEDLQDYVELRHTDGKVTTLEDGEIMITQNASLLLELEAGDSALLQTLQLEQADIVVSDVVENYLGNYIYMTQATYETCFGEYQPNGALVNISDTCKDQILFCDALAKQEGILSCVSTASMEADFATAFMLINMVVYIVIIMAACLAFVVLFTLATTNISERIRELATIKVLGFYDNEVHAYVNKETMILTGIGILLGVPLGYAFAQTLTSILTLPSMYLAVSLHPISYVISGGLSLIFAVIVNVITDKSLDIINPVEALKSVE